MTYLYLWSELLTSYFKPYFSSEYYSTKSIKPPHTCMYLWIFKFYRKTTFLTNCSEQILLCLLYWNTLKDHGGLNVTQQTAGPKVSGSTAGSYILCLLYDLLLLCLNSVWSKHQYLSWNFVISFALQSYFI